jgi:hypothetical protein
MSLKIDIDTNQIIIHIEYCSMFWLTRFPVRRILSSNYIYNVRHSSGGITKEIVDVMNKNKEILSKFTNRSSKAWKILGGITLSGTFMGYIYYDDIMQYLGKHGANVAKTTLEDDVTKQGTIELTKHTLHGLLNDNESKEVVKKYMTDIVIELCESPDIQNSVSILLAKAIETENCTLATKKILQTLLADKDVTEYINNLTVQIISSQDIKNEVNTTLSYALNQLADDPEIKKLLADTLWETVKLSITPSFIQSNSKPKT